MDTDLDDIKIDFNQDEAMENQMPLLSEKEQERIIKDNDYSLTLDENEDGDNACVCLEDILEVLNIIDEKPENEIKDCDEDKTNKQTNKQGLLQCSGSIGKTVTLNVLEGKENKNDSKFAMKSKRESVKIVAKKGQSNNLEDFFLTLLTDDAYRSFIRWRCKEKNEFTIENPRQVANFWGKIKNKRKFTPDNLTREIRKLRNAGRLKKLDLKGCYRFMT